MMLVRIIVIAVLGIVAACGGSKTLKCDEGPYQAAVRAPRIQAPDGLDNLSTTNEMPLPEASPQVERPADGTCLEEPPQTMSID